MARLEDIRRLLEQKRSIKEISSVLKCRKQTVIDVKRKLLTPEMLLEAQRKGQTRLPPSWPLNLDWVVIEGEIGRGFELKKIWEEYAASQTSYSNFFKYVRKRFNNLLSKTVTLREFSPGEHSEVDYAGNTVEWIDSRGEIHEAQVFLGILCFSQLIFAHATENQKKENWLLSHCKMFEEFKGVPKVVVPDNLKSGVTRSHLYDPDLNPDYTDLAKYYETAIVPARSRHPKDKALVEGAVKLVMRLFKWIYRRHTFTCIDEINKALKSVAGIINSKQHTRFKISRLNRFETDEKHHLKTLPLEPWEGAVWKLCVLHPDCTVAIEKNYYSAPYALRGKTLRVKMTTSKIEIFYDMERVGLHYRIPLGKVGLRVLDLNHLPQNSRAYLEVTPQNLLSQSKFIHPKLHQLVQILFDRDVLGNLRRAQGLIRKSHSLIQLHGHAVASDWIVQAIDYMIRFDKIRVKLFEDLIKAEQKKIKIQEDRTIVRKPGNPMIRGVGRNIGITAVPDLKPIN